MIVYNVTAKIDPAISNDWIEWQKNEHIPEIMETGLFSDFKLFHLLEQNEEEGVTYVVQYFTSSMDNYNNYIRVYAPRLRQKSMEKWGNRFIAFRTIMEVVH